jgi:hypothetical protein
MLLRIAPLVVLVLVLLLMPVLVLLLVVVVVVLLLLLLLMLPLLLLLLLLRPSRRLLRRQPYHFLLLQNHCFGVETVPLHPCLGTGGTFDIGVEGGLRGSHAIRERLRGLARPSASQGLRGRTSLQLLGGGSSEACDPGGEIFGGEFVGGADGVRRCRSGRERGRAGGVGCGRCRRGCQRGRGRNCPRMGGGALKDAGNGGGAAG